MIAGLVLCAIGAAAGFLLMRRFPAVPLLVLPERLPSVSVVVPARNEAHNLPKLLQSLPAGCQVLVVDDCSTDGTAEVAEAHGATVMRSAPLPEGWVGKSWACQQGADAADGNVLMFLDADTWFSKGGYERLLACALQEGERTAVSVLPFHCCEKPYEQVSLFFHLMMAFGAAGFSRLGEARLVGPSLVMSRTLYREAGGHATVRDQILENLALSSCIERRGGRVFTLKGAGVLETRMFPQGFGQLRESWSKAFAAGAGKTPKIVLVVCVLWLAGGVSALGLLASAGEGRRGMATCFYLVFAAQAAWGGRQLGNYRWSSFVLYPIPLVVYFCIFAQSLWWKVRGTRVLWRGRSV